MNDRRDFLKTTVVTSSLLAMSTVPKAFAAVTPRYTNVIYTKDNPGRWTGKEDSHSPQVTLNGSKVEVATKHPMSNEHFIVKHTLVLENGTYIGSKIFTPADKPESSYELPAGYKGKCYVTSFCNQHDFWLAAIMV